MLKGHDRTGFTQKCSFQVSDSLIRGLVGKRQIGLGDTLDDGSAYVALVVYKTLPDSIRRRDAEIHVQGAQGLSFVAERNHDEFQEPPQDAGAEPQASDLVGGPHAEGVPAAVVACFAIVAEYAPPAIRSMSIALRVTDEIAVKNQCSGAFAGRARRQFQALMQAEKIILRTAELWKRKAQKNPPKQKAGIIPAREILPRHGGEVGGVRFKKRARLRGLRRGPDSQVTGVLKKKMLDG